MSENLLTWANKTNLPLNNLCINEKNQQFSFYALAKAVLRGKTVDLDTFIN